MMPGKGIIIYITKHTDSDRFCRFSPNVDFDDINFVVFP